MNMSENIVEPIPDHVPAELVENDFPFMGQMTEQNPFEEMAQKACKGPDVAYVPGMVPGGGNCWILRRQDDLAEVFTDTEHFSNQGFSGLPAMIGESWKLVPAEQDPPTHTYYRQLLSPIFAPGPMSKMEGVVRVAIQDCLRPFKNKTECDFVQDIGFPFPVGVILDLMGLPKARMSEFQEWENMIFQSGGKHESMQNGVRNISKYLREVIAERKKNPADDLISLAIKAEVNGRQMNDDELLGYAFNFFIGGLDTVTANLGNFVRHLAINVEHQRALRKNPEKIRLAVEEFMRYFAGNISLRICVKERKIRGVTIKPGDKIGMFTTMAMRDPDKYDDPHELRLDRNPRHISFATGPHHCLGVHLARRELRIGLEEILSALPEFRLKPNTPVLTQAGIIVQTFSLPIVWG